MKRGTNSTIDALAETIASEIGHASSAVAAVCRLLDEGATVPFIARYRKERTGGLSDEAILAIRDHLHRLRELEERRETILHTIEEQGKLTKELREQITRAGTRNELEDLYLPYRPKRRTRATAAREKGLDPLARSILEQRGIDPSREAERYVQPGGAVPTVEDALSGARDLIAEAVHDDPDVRAALRTLFSERAELGARRARGATEEAVATYRDWIGWKEPAHRAPSHRILALLRGRNEGVLTCFARPEDEKALELVRRKVVTGEGADARLVAEAADDAYKRLLRPALETELIAALKERADQEAARIFANNLRSLLMAPPFGTRAVLALDPGMRTGCKVVALDARGELLASETVFPLPPKKQMAEAAATLSRLAERFRPEAIAVGDGTGGREAYEFCRELALTGKDGTSLPVILVSESGASVYSASEVARRELPDQDVTVRGAVSIGRRLQDPLSELVKIDPKSIGVGQYQHDVDPGMLRRALDDVVAGCVNAVGVELNSASEELLTAVSGLGRREAKAVLRHRAEHGAFRSRRQLLEVPGIGPKTFEQAAGFLRIRGADNPLDESAVHPERYEVVERIAADLGTTPAELIGNEELCRKMPLERYVEPAGSSAATSNATSAGSSEVPTLGLHTLRDIRDELAKPGRDPRDSFTEHRFTEGITDIQQLEPGMRLNGVVTNVTAFGAFVDVGVHRDGLVHVSRLADRFVRDPAEVVRPGLQVTVTVLEVDLERKRISLSMRRQDGAGSEDA